MSEMIPSDSKADSKNERPKGACLTQGAQFLEHAQENLLF